MNKEQFLDKWIECLPLNSKDQDRKEMSYDLDLLMGKGRRERIMKAENNFIQWKGTDLCMDFHCECGTHNHYDGYFAYHVKCKGCGQVYKMDTSVMMEKVDGKDCTPLEDETE